MKKNERVGGLYLCLFSQGTIKIGMGVDAAARLSSHKAAGAVFGIFVTRTDVIPCELPRKAEKLLIEWCAANSTACNGREWFNGVDYEACFEAAKAAALAMMGPHRKERSGRELVQAIIDRFDQARTREGQIYAAARRMMVQKEVSSELINALDYMHRVSESVRANMRMGAPMPQWFDDLNCFEPWENELWHDEGRPTPELLGAIAAAILAIERLEKAGEGAHV